PRKLDKRSLVEKQFPCRWRWLASGAARLVFEEQQIPDRGFRWGRFDGWRSRREELDDLVGQRLRTFGVDGVPGVVEEERVAVGVRQLDCELCRVGEDVSRRDVVVRTGA